MFIKPSPLPWNIPAEKENEVCARTCQRITKRERRSLAAGQGIAEGIQTLVPRFHQTGLPVLLLIACCTMALLSGCIAPRPSGFVDAEALPSHYLGRDYRVFANGQTLTIEVSQMPGSNVVGFDLFAQDGALYVSPRRVHSGGGDTRKFGLDVSRFHLAADWPTHTFWLVESKAYLISDPGFWSSAKRSPWVRKKM
jgi:hypothetical protein